MKTQKILSTVVALLLLTLTTFSQNKPITTFILIRHAEKDLTQSTPDPDLSAQGKVRANTLTNLLKQTDIQAVYSTDFKRTRQTLEPLATARSLTINIYDPRKNSDIDAILEKHEGQTILVSGHSNTIPQFANYLLGEEKYKPLEDDEYGNIIIVSVTARGKDAKVVWIVNK
jgi:2,3-bisphosphoglycerate-dependent phosphoglycerate mutase